MSVTGDFAAFIAASLGIVLPAAVQRVTCRAFANWVGCALGAALFDACISLERLLDTAALRQHWTA